VFRRHSALDQYVCDNALLAAYAAGEAVVSRRTIEEVAENLDLLPRSDHQAHANEKPAEKSIRAAS
jgi:hypothetical protein